MAKIAVPTTLCEAHDVQTVWETVPNFVMGEITLSQFIATQNAADALSKSYLAKDNELTGIRSERDDKLYELRDLITRFRSGMRSMYGPDSTQYERAGGTRASARKRPTRKAIKEPSNANAPQA